MTGSKNSDALLLLQLEHERLGDILSILNDEVAKMPSRHDADLVDDCLTYMLEYPDTCHHPKEDLIAKRLDASGSSPEANLERDHELLHDLTAETVLLFRSRSEIDLECVGQLRDFIQTYRDHIAHENEFFFPLALRTLSQADFDAIDFGVFDAPDPVFDSEQERRFTSLRDRIVATRSVKSR